MPAYLGRLRPSRRNGYRMFHGTPYGDMRSFREFKPKLAFFAPTEKVAEDYTKPMGEVWSATRRPEGVTSSTPTVYEVDVDVDPERVFDTRRPEHKAIYDEIRREVKARYPDDPDEWFDRDLSRSGVPGQSAYWGYFPSWGSARGLIPHLRERGFKAAFIAEGGQGTSLMVFDDIGDSVRILDTIELERRRNAMEPKPELVPVSAFYEDFQVLLGQLLGDTVKLSEADADRVWRTPLPVRRCPVEGPLAAQARYEHWRFGGWWDDRDEQYYEELKESIADEMPMPPVVLFQGRMVDGYHRVLAHLDLKISEIECVKLEEWVAAALGDAETRRNSTDAELRLLERRAATGDPEAKAKWRRELVRMGRAEEERAFLIDLAPEASVVAHAAGVRAVLRELDALRFFTVTVTRSASEDRTRINVFAKKSLPRKSEELRAAARRVGLVFWGVEGDGGDPARPFLEFFVYLTRKPEPPSQAVTLPERFWPIYKGGVERGAEGKRRNKE